MRVFTSILLWLLAGLAALNAAAQEPEPAPPPATVGIDLSAVEEGHLKQLELTSLHRKLAVRLTEAGFAVVDPGRRPQIKLVFSVEPQQTVVVTAETASSAALSCRVPAGAVALAYHLELIHKTVELTRQAAARSRPASRPTSRPASLPASLPASPPGPPPPPPPPKVRTAWPVELALGAMASYRLQGTDPLFRLGARLGVMRALGLRASAAISPSLSDDLSVVEWSLQLGSSWRWGLGASLHLEVAALVGFLNHHYSMAGWSPASGSRWDLLGTLALELGWRLTERLGLCVWLAPGLSEQSRVHEIGTGVLWERSLFRLEGGALAVLRL